MRLKNYDRNQNKLKEYIQANFHYLHWMSARQSMMPL